MAYSNGRRNLTLDVVAIFKTAYMYGCHYYGEQSDFTNWLKMYSLRYMWSERKPYERALDHEKFTQYAMAILTAGLDNLPEERGKYHLEYGSQRPNKLTGQLDLPLEMTYHDNSSKGIYEKVRGDMKQRQSGQEVEVSKPPNGQEIAVRPVYSSKSDQKDLNPKDLVKEELEEVDILKNNLKTSADPLVDSSKRRFHRVAMDWILEKAKEWMSPVVELIPAHSTEKYVFVSIFILFAIYFAFYLLLAVDEPLPLEEF